MFTRNPRDNSRNPYDARAEWQAHEAWQMGRSGELLGNPFRMNQQWAQFRAWNQGHAGWQLAEHSAVDPVQAEEVTERLTKILTDLKEINRVLGRPNYED